MSHESARGKFLKRPPEKILIIKPSSLGDVVHSLPFLNAIRTCFPKAGIDWVIAKGLEGLLEGHPMVDRLIVIDKDRWKKISRASSTLRELRDLFGQVGRGKYDLAIDLQGLLRSGLIAMASRASVRIGFSEAREGSRLFYNWKVSGGRNVHAVDRYLKIAAALGCEAVDTRFPFPHAVTAAGEAEKLRREIGEYVVVVPGARWETKIWPAEYFGQAVARLPLRSIVVGSASDIGISGRVVAASGGKAFSLAGKTDVSGLIEIMRGARLAISNDSGPMHIAAAFGVPVVAVFGPTSAERTGPYGRRNVIVRSGLPCAPCFRKKCGDPKCMKQVSPEDVFRRAMELLGGGRSS
ncbi:MAG: glycosyltransferase family 9 protein [Nitrospiraceae bacterium]|nr:glycosyltransferase family 9 protein [Nitrospiraceae bacterium]